MVETGNREVFRGVAPGRLDVMGGIADYSGSLLLQMPIAEKTVVDLIKRHDGVFRVQTDAEVNACEALISLQLLRGCTLEQYGQRARQAGLAQWALYVLGCFKVLEEELGLEWNGADVEIRSSVPVGKGVSSSAAIEVAALHAICKGYDLKIDPIRLSLLAQRVENRVVGAACGLMDQLSVNLGRKGHLLPIICQPHEVLEPCAIPSGVRFYGLDSGVRHAVSGASYGEVRTAAFMGYVIAVQEAGHQPAELPYQGYLANIPLDEFLLRYQPLIPETLTGRGYLEKYGLHIDPVTIVSPDVVYRPRACATHPVRENHRIKIFYEGIRNGADPDQLGQLMLESHQGYNDVGLGERVTNRIVELVRDLGLGHGIAGARTSGGGSGGTVTMMVTSEQGYQVLMRIKAAVEADTGKLLKLFEGSSDGAHYQF